MMIFVPPCSASASSCDFAPPSPAMWATTPGVRSIWRIASCSWASRTLRSVITRTESNTGLLASSCSTDSRCASQEMLLVLPDPAECWIRYRCPGPCCTGGLDQPGDRLPLVEAREQHRLATGLLARHRIDLVGDLQVQEPPEDVQPGVALQDLLPQVRRRRAVRVRRVPGVMVVAPVERQERGVLPGQLGGHLHLAVGDREVHHRPRPELQQRFTLGQPVVLVLQHRVGDVLGEVGLQLGGGDRDAVDEEHQVDAVAVLRRVVHLPHHPQPHRVVLLLRGLVQRWCWAGTGTSRTGR